MTVVARLAVAYALLELEARGEREVPALRLQGATDLAAEELDVALLELYLEGMISYTNAVGVMGRLAAAVLGGESSYRLTARGRAALAGGLASDCPLLREVHHRRNSRADNWLEQRKARERPAVGRHTSGARESWRPQ